MRTWVFPAPAVANDLDSADCPQLGIGGRLHGKRLDAALDEKAEANPADGDVATRDVGHHLGQLQCLRTGTIGVGRRSAGG